MEIEPGTQLGNFEVLGKLGSGAMGEVFRAKDLRLGREVALKLLPPELTSHKEALARFEREARALAAINHPGIAAIYELGDDDGLLYLVMELVKGETLLARLENAPFKFEDALRLFERIAEALEAAHEQGIIHRDLKPANIMLTDAGLPKILDFGLAKVVRDSAGLEVISTVPLALVGSNETSAGALIGTPAYMSPEQALGETADRRADVWAFGCCLYQALTRRKVFDNETVVGTLEAICTKEPDWDFLPSDAPSYVTGLLERCLRKDRRDRLGNIGEARLEIQRNLVISGVEERGEEDSVLKVLLHTDIEGSTKLAQKLGDSDAARIKSLHDELLRKMFAKYRGKEVSDAGDGFFAVFDVPSEAVLCALEIQNELPQLDLPVKLRVRIGIHMGEIIPLGSRSIGGRVHNNYSGLAIDSCSRVMGLAFGGQILTTRAVFDSARQHLAPEDLGHDLRWLAHGSYSFKGVDEAVEIFEAGIEGVAPLIPPRNSGKARRAIPAGEELTLGWRPAREIEIPDRRGWTLKEKLGEGGFGEVWTAENTRTKQTHAFKFCFKAERLRNLRRELTLFRLMKEVLGERPDIAKLYEVQLEEAPYYLEMEYTRGGDLDRWSEVHGGIEELPLQQRLDLVSQVARATAAAHSVGIIHKDIKPTNVLIHDVKNANPQIRLTDFGIGQLMSQNALDAAGITGAGLSTMDAGDMSELASRTGTRVYMSPELLVGKSPSIQSDVYALGVMLYQMVAGDLHKPLAQGWQRDVEDPLLREDISACIDGDPELRLKSASEVAERIDSLEDRRAAEEAERRRQEESRQTLESARRSRQRVRALVGVVILAAILGGVFALIALRETRLKKVAVGARHEADLARGDAISEHYYASIQFASGAVANNQFDSAVAALESAPSESRGWEWAHLKQRTGRASLTLEGHDDALTCALFGPQGNRIVTASRDGSARIWNSITGEEIILLDGHTGWVTGAAFSPKGQRVLTFSTDRTAIVRDASTGVRIASLEGHEAEVTDGLFSPKGDFIITGSADRTARVWDAFSGKEKRVLLGHNGPIVDVAFDPTNSRALTASQDGTARVWDVETGQEIWLLRGHAGPLLCSSYSPDGRFIATSSNDGSSRIWDAKTGKGIHVLAGHNAPVTKVRFSNDGTRVLTASLDGSIRLWNQRSGKLIAAPLPHPSGVLDARFSASGDQVYSIALDETVRVWDLSLGREHSVISGHSGRLSSLDVSDKKGIRILTASFDGTAKLWDPSKSGHSFRVLSPQGPCRSRFSRMDQKITVSSYDGKIQVWDLKRLKLDRTFDSGGAPVLEACVSPGGDVVAAAVEGKGIVVWNFESGNQVKRLGPAGVEIQSFDFSPDGELLATGSDDKIVRVWNFKNGRTIQSLRGHGDLVNCVRFGPDGLRLVSSSNDKTIIAWDVASGDQLRVFRGHTAAVLAVAFDAEGHRIVSSSADKTARLWDFESASEIRSFTGHSDWVTGASIHPTEARLATASNDGSVKIWDLNNARQIMNVLRSDVWVTSIDFSPGGETLAAGSDTGITRLWGSVSQSPLIASASK